MDCKILIIDDDKIIRKVTSHMVKFCKPFSSDPLLFENGMEAFNYLAMEENKHIKYILFLDINMPILNGWAFLEKLEKEKLMHKKVIYLMTSSVDKEDHRKAINNKYIKNIITKPITIKKIASLLTIS